MLTSWTLPVLTFLVSVPSLPGLPPLTHLPRLRHPKAVVDTLPPVWKPASRLALEDQFVFANLPAIGLEATGIQLASTSDPRRLRVTVDPDSGTVSTGFEAGAGVTLGTAGRMPLAQFGNQLTQRTFARLWAKKSRESINSLGENTPSSRHSGLQLALPYKLPSRVQSILGPGGPALNVSGSESIRLSGTSNWTNQQIGLLGQKRSLFPSLDMQQDLDIRLEGQLSDRVKVNLLQNSANQIPLSNKIAINYKGDEDDLVQSLDLGNTNLSLPGTQYVSYSGRNEGLFGVKAATRMGPLDLTVLASKQEGRSERATYAGGASHQSYSIADVDYVRGTYFFLYDPNVEPTWDVPDTSIRLYLDDYNYGNDVSGTFVRGRALIDPTAGSDTNSVRGSFTLLQPGADKDYEIMPDVYGPLYKVLRLKRPVSGEQRLAVSYVRRPVNTEGIGVGGFTAVGGQFVPDSPDTALALRLKLIRPPASTLRPDSAGINYDPNRPFAPARELELKNFYQLPGQRIDPKSLILLVRRGVDQPPLTSVRLPSGTPAPYIELLGLDNYDETSGTPVRGHDGRVDGTLLNSNTRAFVDYENGVLFFPDPHPFAPRVGQDVPGPGGLEPRFRFDQAVSNVLTRRDSLVAPPDSSSGANLAIYDKYNLQRAIDTRYYIDVDFTAARATGEINLGRGNVIEGSDVVTINGQPLVRDRDYTIDYDLGRVVLKRQLGPADDLNVNYSYAPLFQQAGRTLLGSAFRLEGRDRNLGGAFLYESKGAQDLRPRLGEEPSRTLITDLNTDWGFKPEWMTRMVDALPGVRTTAPSDFRVQAEVGASFPNPNTRNEIFIDDMEGVRDAVSLSMTPDRWRWSGVPSRLVNGFRRGLLDSLSGQPVFPGVHDAEIHWFSPPASVKERDLKPSLTDAQGAQNNRQILALSVPRRPTSAAATDSLWAGLVYPLDPVGLDLSRSQFIELWISDFADEHVPGSHEARLRGDPSLGIPSVKLHLDLGVVSEDEMRAPNLKPNKRLDTEDQVPRDNQLTVGGGVDEDTGLDGVNDRTGEAPDAPADLTTADPARDPEGDDFQGADERFKALDPRRYRFTNGTEKNRQIDPFPDTEDLNLNSQLDTQEEYFEYTIDLGDSLSPYLVTDVRKEFTRYANNGQLIPSDNGWRRYRIPIGDSLRVAFGTPDLTLARHMRLWLEGISNPDPPPPPGDVGAFEVRPLVMLGGLDIVGSRWQVTDLDSLTHAQGTTVTLNSVNSLDNADVYVPPFDPGQTRTGSQGFTRREQSIALEVSNLGAGRLVEGYRTFSLDENYSRYGRLQWFVTGFEMDFGLNRPEQVQYFVRFASDERGANYYEYRAPVPSSAAPRAVSWQEVSVALAELSSLKLATGFPRNDPIDYRQARSPGAAETLIVHGRPSFTRLRRVSFGLVNGGSKQMNGGQLWFDELRATEIAKDQGRAQRVMVTGRLSNLLNYNLNWGGRDEDFLSVGESRGQGSRTDNLSLAGGVDLHRFFEGTGIVLPLGYSYTRNTSNPRFSAGDDVVRTGAIAEASETRSESRSWSTSYSRNWSERSNPFLRYTLGGITANYGRTRSLGRSPSSTDTTTTANAGVSYTVAPRKLLPVPIPRSKFKLYPLPERFYWNYSLATVEAKNYTRQRIDDSLTLANQINGRTAFLDYGADSRPFDLLSHHFEARRNLTLPEPLLERVGFINLGRVVSWRQNMSSQYMFKKGLWLKPGFNWTSNYTQNNGPELSSDLSVRAITNGQTLSMNWDFPFERLAVARPAAPPPRTGPPPPPPRAPGTVSPPGLPPAPPRFPPSPRDSIGSGRDSLRFDPGRRDSTGAPRDSSAAPAVPGPVTAPDTTRRAPPAADTTAVARAPRLRLPPLRWRELLTHLGTLQTSSSVAKSSGYTRLLGTPSFLYLAGITSDPGIGSDADPGRVRPLFGSQSSDGVDLRTNGGTRISLPLGVGLNTRVEFGSRVGKLNGVKGRSTNSRFPEFDVEYGDLARAMRVDRVLSNPSLRTSYGRSRYSEFDNNDHLISVASSSEWRPMLGLTGDFKNGTRTDLRVERRVTQRENRQLGNSVTTERNTDINLSLSRSYSAGQKVSFLGKQTTVRSSATLALAMVYSRLSGETINRSQPGARPQFPKDNDRLSVNLTGSYGFGSNVTGNLAIGFGQNRDLRRDIVSRNVRVELRAQFTF